MNKIYPKSSKHILYRISDIFV